MAWKTYLHYFRNPIASAKPNAGHLALAQLEQLMEAEGKDVQVVTQNVDALHQRAGSAMVHELHGTVYRHVCSRHKHVHEYQIDPVDLDNTDYDATTDPFFDRAHPPRCSTEGCNSYLRPDATLFTEGLSQSTWALAELAVRSLANDDVLLVIGTSGVVYPAASLPGIVAEKGKASIIEINPERSALTQSLENAGGTFVQTTAGTFLPQVLERYRESLSQ